MFATALNLLPGGQLDGGHIVYATFPRAHRWTSRGMIIVLLLISWWWLGWLIWAFLLRMSGMRHPQVPLEPGLGGRRRALFFVAVAMLLLTFIAAPLDAGGMPDIVRAVAEGIRAR
jgi:membrane-associated protease RseP (regulator of RpoE activity)